MTFANPECQTPFLAWQVKAEATKLGLPVTFYGARDHLDASLHGYQVFINPSTSDVVATTSAGASTPVARLLREGAGKVLTSRLR